MAEAAVEFLLNNLKELLVYNVQLILGVKDEVDSLCNDLSLLAAFVKDTTERHRQHEVVKELIRQIRVEIYKAEDVIDMYVVQVSVQKSRTKIRKILHPIKHMKELGSIKNEIQRIRTNMRTFQDSKWFGYEALQLQKEKEKEKKEKEKEKKKEKEKEKEEEEEAIFVGFDEEAKEMVGWLKEGTKELDVISVVGMGGLGKTTLVRKVYNDSSIQKVFSRSWVYVSQVYNRKETYCKIWNEITQENIDTSQWSDEILTKELRIKLQDVRYLIVLDDVWTKQAWNDLKTVFPKTKKGSRIVLTSRHKDVARLANTNRNPYQLRFLTNDESWELLVKKVFSKGSHCPKDLERIGKKIAQKCYGLPLALDVIAKTLHDDKDKLRSLWKDVEEEVNTPVSMNLEECMDNLQSSYDVLPYTLKACFLYFGVFPENFEIPVRKLIHIWVAEGFYEKIRDASAEEMAEKSLQDLVDRNLVLVGKRRANGRIKTCRIHKMLHKICVKLAEEENFFKEIKGSELSSNATVFRRLGIHSEVSNYLSLKPDSTHARSFLCYADANIVLTADLIRDFPGSLQLLRVLDVQPIIFSCFPGLQLLHLRYVAVSGTFNVLPEAISNLWNLQTIIVETTFSNIEVKADLLKLSQLRHVYTSAASNFPTPSAKSRKKVNDPLVGKNLRTMSKVSPETCTDVIFIRTPNLQKLGVRGNLMSLMEETEGGCKFDNIAKLTQLKTLKLLNDTDPSSRPDGKLQGLPSWQKFPSKLNKLTISGTLLNWEHMSTLGSLPGLEVLKLGDNAFVGECWETPNRSFLQLRLLEIGKTDLATWKKVGDSFPQLQRLNLKHCEKLVAVPSDLGGLQRLEVVELRSTSHSAVASANHLIERNVRVDVFS